MILKITRLEESKLIELIENDSIMDSTRVTKKDKTRILELCKSQGLTGAASDIETMDLITFEDFIMKLID